MKLVKRLAVQTEKGLVWEDGTIGHKEIVEKSQKVMDIVKTMTVGQELWEYGSGEPISGPIGYAVADKDKNIIAYAMIGISFK